MRVLVGVWGGSFNFFLLFGPAEPPAQCRARVQVKRRYLRRRAVAFSSLFNFALPPPSSAQSKGATRVPCSRVMWYRAMYGSVCHLLSFVCCICSTLFQQFQSPPRGVAGVATFHPGYLSIGVIFYLMCVAFVLLCFSTKHSFPSRGCRCCHLPSRVFVVSSSNPPPCRWSAGGFSHDFSLVLAPVFPSILTRARLAIVPFL